MLYWFHHYCTVVENCDKLLLLFFFFFKYNKALSCGRVNPFSNHWTWECDLAFIIFGYFCWATGFWIIFFEPICWMEKKHQLQNKNILNCVLDVGYIQMPFLYVFSYPRYHPVQHFTQWRELFLERKCESLPRRSNCGTSVNKDFCSFCWYQTGSVKYSNDWSEEAEDRSLSTGLVCQL